GTYVCYLVQTGYSPAGGPPWASAPAWTSLDTLPAVAARIKNLIQKAGNTGAAASVTATFAGATAAGTLLVAYMSNPNGLTAATFPAGWAAATSGSGVSGGTKEGAVVYYYANNPGGITSVAATMTGATGVSLVISEFAGAATSSPLDKVGNAGSAGSKS